MIFRKIKNFVNDIRATGKGSDLNKLGKIYRTDKIQGHNYAPHYMFHFEQYRHKKINLLEIGVGGYEKRDAGGKSLRMWKKYFSKAQINAIDIYDKSPLEESRIRIFKGSQIDKEFMNDTVTEIGDLDIIIDDGSHVNEHVIETFKQIFPKLKDGGLYVVEDTQTSYWEDHGGDSNDLNNPLTMMSFFKKLTDGLNHKEFMIPNYQQSYFDKKIVSIHFYHNLIFIYKGDNDEESNLLVNNQMPKKDKE